MPVTYDTTLRKAIIDLDETDFLSDVPLRFSNDFFNLTNLEFRRYPYYDIAFLTILGHYRHTTYSKICANNCQCTVKSINPPSNYKSTAFKDILSRSHRAIYYLIHERFLRTEEGLSIVYHNFCDGIYGRCSNTECNNFSLLPYTKGRREAHFEPLMLHCLRCDTSIPAPPSNILMGAAFGPNLIGALILNYRDKFHALKLPPPSISYFGYKIRWETS